MISPIEFNLALNAGLDQKKFVTSECITTKFHPFNSTRFQCWFQHDFPGWIQPKMVCKIYKHCSQISPIEINQISMLVACWVVKYQRRIELKSTVTRVRRHHVLTCDYSATMTRNLGNRPF